MRLAVAAAVAACLCAPARAEPSWPALDEAAAAAAAGDRLKALELLGAAARKEKDPGRREHAAIAFQTLKEYGRARAMLEELIRESPREPRLRLELACVLALKGDRGATLEALRLARKLGPNALERRRMAFLHQDLKDYEPARELLDALVLEAPTDLGVRLDRASLAAQTGDIPAGLAHLDAAAALDPLPDERRRMAIVYRDLRENDRARALLQALADEFPADAGLSMELATLAARSGDRAAALAALANARARSPGFDDLRRIEALYLELHEFAAARSVLEDIVKAAPRSPGAVIELASFETRRGEREPALAALAKARALGPDMQERQRMALLYEDLREYAAARSMIDALIAEEPRDPQLRLERAFFAADLGDRKAALRYLDETNARSPDPDDRRRMALLRERLDEKSR